MKPQEVWAKLSSIDCSNNVQKKNGLTFLSWSWAWHTLMDSYPDSFFSFEKDAEGSEFWSFPDGTGEVRCSVVVQGVSRSMSLPVMDYRNDAIKNPSARHISDAKARCLVKTIALFGLGLYIYAGEDIPSAKAEVKPEKPAGPPQGELPLGADVKGVEIPIGKWEGEYLHNLTESQLETLWEYRKKFEDYPDFISALQEWRRK